MNYAAMLLGWLMLQAAWQSAAVAAFLALSLRWSSGSPAARRYRWSALHLAGILAAVALAGIVSHASIAGALSSGIRHMAPVRFSAMEDRAWPWLQVAGWIWLAGIVAFQALLAACWVRLQLFVRQAAAAPPATVALVEELSRDAGLLADPEVRCAAIDSPMTAGCRPAFLFVPHAFAEMWTAAEQRALLAHEIAHVESRDYARKLLHLWAASLVWWHPATWMVCARIRHERECSADERAIQLTGSAAPLARALVRLAEPRSNWLAAAAASGDLADRIGRLARRPVSTPRRLPLHALAAIALIAVTIVFSSAAAHRGSLARAYASSAAAPPTLIEFHAQDPAGTFLVKMVRGRVLSIDLGADPVPLARIRQTGATVQVLGDSGREVLRLEVDPRGGLFWNARQRS